MTVATAATNVYLNGGLDSSGSGITTGGNNKPLLIGTSYSTPCSTELDEVQIFSRALLQSEIVAIYNAGSAGKCKCEPTIIDCPKSHEEITLAGIADDFAPTPVDPLPNPGVCGTSAPFDATASNQAFCHTFTGLPSGIVGATLEIGLRNLGTGNPCNDTVSLQSDSGPSWSRFIGTDNSCFSPTITVGLLPTPWNTFDQRATFCLFLDRLPLAGGGLLNLLPLTGGDLRVSVQDDTAVDYVRLHYQSCEGLCGPGPHWIDTCPAGIDFLDGTEVYVSIDLPPLAPSCPAEVAVKVTGDAVILRGAGSPHSIPTEMISMTATGGGLTLTAGAGGPLPSPCDPSAFGPTGLRRSCGTIAEKDPSTGHSYFNVFFEVRDDTVNPPRYLYNHDPCVMEAQLTKVPPKVAIYTRTPAGPAGCLPLYSSPSGGVVVGQLGATWHGVGTDPTPGACCAPDNHCTQLPELACKELGKGYVFRGVGIPCGSDGTCIPALSEWGVAVMALLVLTAGTIVVMRRRAAVAG
jgi:hypothetical protein